MNAHVQYAITDTLPDSILRLSGNAVDNADHPGLVPERAKAPVKRHFKNPFTDEALWPSGLLTNSLHSRRLVSLSPPPHCYLLSAISIAGKRRKHSHRILPAARCNDDLRLPRVLISENSPALKVDSATRRSGRRSTSSSY